MPERNPTDLTGRDEQMITKALSYAIEAIARLPDRQQEASDCADMMTVFKARVPDAAQPAHRLARAGCSRPFRPALHRCVS